MCQELCVANTFHLLAPNGKKIRMEKGAVSKVHSSALKECEAGTAPPPPPRCPDHHQVQTPQ